MKMSEFVNNILDKDMLITLIAGHCTTCPFYSACHMNETAETCEQFLNRYIEDDRNEG